MLRVPTVHAKPGMTLALPVLHPKRLDTVLLNAGVRLEQVHIRRLREIELADLWIRYPKLEQIGQFVSEDVQRAWGEVTGLIDDAFEALGRDTDARLDYLAYKRAIQGLIEQLTARPKSQLFMREMVESQRALLRHASNVAFVSVLMGLRLEFYVQFERPKLAPAAARDVSSLGVGAMLHDVGVLRLPRPIRMGEDGRPDETDPQWRRHPRLGYELIRGNVEPSAAAVVLCHHQRFDGTGFPTRIDPMGNELPVKGRNIHIFARIAAAADLFDRLRHPDGGGASLDPAAAPDPKSRGRALPVVEVLRRMQEPPYAAWLDPVVLTGLIAVCPPYPPGCRVRLSDGTSGVVTQWNQEDPCRPTVALVGDAFEDATDEEACSRPLSANEVVDLTMCPGLEVVEADGQDVRRSNFYPSGSRRYGLTRIERAIAQRARTESRAA